VNLKPLFIEGDQHKRKLISATEEAAIVEVVFSTGETHQYKLRPWKRGCLGFDQIKPVTAVSSDLIIFRRGAKDIEILVGTRGSGRWQGGMPMITFGGFISADDSSVLHTAMREVTEEVPGMEIKVDPRTLCQTGPLKFSYAWISSLQKPVLVRDETGKPNLVQDIAIATFNFLGECLGGEPQPTQEVPEAHWVTLTEMRQTERVYAFDHALAIPELITHFNHQL
jgi:hypothetical protein